MLRPPIRPSRPRRTWCGCRSGSSRRRICWRTSRSHSRSRPRPPEVDPLDLEHLGHERVIGAYLLETPDGPALFDCGPTTCITTLKGRLAARGVELQDVQHLLLSHIHLDHAGAAGVLVREHPELQVHVSAVGAPHLVDPSRLEQSARRLYGAEFDTLWGEVAA